MARKSRWPVFTVEWAQKIVDEYLEILCLNEMIPEGGMSSYEVNDRRYYVIYMRSNFKSEMFLNRWYETFVHELIHIFHYIYDLPSRENRVERECVAFFASHREFVIKLFSDVMASSKCLKHSLPEDSPEDLKRKPKPEEMVLSILNQKYGQS